MITIIGLIAIIAETLKSYKESTEKVVKIVHKEFPTGHVDEFVDPTKLNPKRGDIIEYECNYFYHYALYIGNSKILHLNRDGKIHEDPINYNTINNWYCRVNNKVELATKLRLKPRSIEEMISLAQTELNKYVGYNLLNNNCEHRVMYWKYGFNISDQIKFTTQICEDLARRATSTVIDYTLWGTLWAARLSPYDPVEAVIGAGVGAVFGVSLGVWCAIDRCTNLIVTRKLLAP